jgi:hypothetical protein
VLGIVSLAANSAQRFAPETELTDG